MEVYYKFKSEKDYNSIPVYGHFISVANLKAKIIESKRLYRGTRFDLIVTNSQNNEEHLDEATLIPSNTSVIIQRIPGRPCVPIVIAPDKPKLENKPEDVQSPRSSFTGADLSVMNYTEDSEWDDFGDDVYAIHAVLPVQSSSLTQDAHPPRKAVEDSNIKALVDTPALDWQRQTSEVFGPGRGFGRGIGGRMMGGRGFDGLERKTPPQGYICHRCKVPGHFIQHCPTNGDPSYDIKRVKPPAGIPKSMLMATPDGSYGIPSGAVAVLTPNEAAVEKEIEGLPSACSVGNLPPELHCPLCKEVMKDAVFTSKCCFESFCDKCIRDSIISKSMCACGATNILADDLLPNMTLRETINRFLGSNNSSTENGGSAFQVQDMESAHCPQPKIPSPTQSAASRGEQMPPPQKEEALKLEETAELAEAVNTPQKTLEKPRIAKAPDASEATHKSMGVKEQVSEGNAPLVDVEVQQKPVADESGKKKKKKKARLPFSEECKASQDLADENFMMPMGMSAYNPYWTGMQPGMKGYVPPYSGAMPCMNYGMGPLDVSYGGVLPQDPFGTTLPFVPPQWDLVDFAMGFNTRPPIMGKEEFETQKADLKRKREIERHSERDLSKGREFGREMNSNSDISSVKSKSNSIPLFSKNDQSHHHHHRNNRDSMEQHHRDPDLPRPSSKRKLDKESSHRALAMYC